MSFGNSRLFEKGGRMKTHLSIETLVLNGGILLIVLDGSLNTITTEEFNRTIQNHLDQGRSKIILDCRRVESISSVGIGSLVALQARVRKKGGEVKLAGLYGLAADTIRLVRLDKLLGIYGDAEVAREAFYPDPLSGQSTAFQGDIIDVEAKPPTGAPRIANTPDDAGQPPAA